MGFRPGEARAGHHVCGHFPAAGPGRCWHMGVARNQPTQEEGGRALENQPWSRKGDKSEAVL